MELILNCQRSICVAMISGSSERQTVFVISFYISANFVTTLIFLPFLLDSVWIIISDGDVPFPTPLVMAAMPHTFIVLYILNHAIVVFFSFTIQFDFLK